MSSLPIAWIAHPACLAHDMGPDHPESPRRLRAIDERLRIAGLDGFLQGFEAPAARRAALARVHDEAMLARLLDGPAPGEPVRIDADTIFMASTREAALRAAGAAVLGVELVLAQRAGLAFCAVRPPGHHAGRAQPMGFCFFNNVAVGAAEALARGVRRIAILDFDVHYGNGTADIFRDDPRVELYSTYQHPLFPYWSGERGAPNLVDVPLPALCGSEAFRAAVANAWLPRLEAFRPELIMVSAGFDAHADDPLAQLRLRDDDFRWLGALVCDLAEECSQGRVVATLEGGYDLRALGRGVESFLRPFFGASLP